jgi:hypothetical protein
VNASSISIASESMLSSETTSSVSHSSRSQGGEPDDLKIPEAAACVSVGELRAAEGLLGPLELRAMRMCEGFVVIGAASTDSCKSAAVRMKTHCKKVQGPIRIRT